VAADLLDLESFLVGMASSPSLYVPNPAKPEPKR